MAFIAGILVYGAVMSSHWMMYGAAAIWVWLALVAALKFDRGFDKTQR